MKILFTILILSFLSFTLRAMEDENLPTNVIIYIDSNISLKNTDNSLTKYGLTLEDIDKKFKEAGIIHEVRFIPWARIIIEAPQKVFIPLYF